MRAYYIMLIIATVAFLSAESRRRKPKNHGTTINSCISANKKPGKCIELSECNNLLQLYEKEHKSHQEIQFLRNSLCGTEDKNWRVCCENLFAATNPKPQENPQISKSTSSTPSQDKRYCLTPKYERGVCINILKCPFIKDMIVTSSFRHIVNGIELPQEMIKYIKNSACQGLTDDSVCCEENSENISTKANVGNILPSRKECGSQLDDEGIDNSETFYDIVGGNETSPFDYPWMVNIVFDWSPIPCGGSLINERYVVSAAHCFKDLVISQYGFPVVYVGEYDSRNRNTTCFKTSDHTYCKDKVLQMQIEEITKHPDYNEHTHISPNDIALIRLEKNIKYTGFVRPICLPRRDVTDGHVDNDLRFLVSGWGKTENKAYSRVKMHLHVPYMEISHCQKSLRVINLGENQICAGGQQDKDSCNGDSGGPLMRRDENDNRMNLEGIVSFGRSKCGTAPGIYTKVYPYIEWIKQNMKP